MCMRGKFKCLKDIGNNKGKKYVKGTWNIIIVNVNLNTVSIVIYLCFHPVWGLLFQYQGMYLLSY